MATKTYKLGLGANAFSFIIPSGLNLTGATALLLMIKKPDGTEISKILNSSNVSGNNISISVSTDMSDLEGIYDYNVINTSSSKYEIGPILQYTVVLSIT